MIRHLQAPPRLGERFFTVHFFLGMLARPHDWRAYPKANVR